MKSFHLFATTILFVAFISCKKQYDLPPVAPVSGLNKINIAMIKAKYASGMNYKFKGDSSLYCIVTADEISGNLYKEIYVKDGSGALHVKLVNSGGLYIGDSIRINLKGAVLNDNNRLIQLDSLDTESNVVKLASGYNPAPQSLSLTQILANTSATNNVQSKLVKIDNVEFVTADQNQPYADATGKAPLTRVIRSCAGQTLAIRSSGYSSFAAKTTPSHNGSVIGIVSQYGNSMQLLLRDANEISMNKTLCAASGNTTYLTKDFNDNSLSSGGWTSFSDNSAVNWSVASYSNTMFAKISGYSSNGNAAAESWLISPRFNLSASVNPVLSFQTAAHYTGAPLDVLVSVNYSGSAPSSASWTSLASHITLSAASGNYVWTPSGTVPLSAYKSASVYLAFKYSSSASAATTYELDDIVVKEE